MKYKIGDIVRIKSREKIINTERTPWITFVPTMEQVCSLEGRIYGIHSDCGYYIEFRRINIDISRQSDYIDRYVYVDEWLEDV